MSQTKNTLKAPQSSRPFADRIPPKNPFFAKGNFPKFRGANTAFRTQNRGGGGK